MKKQNEKKNEETKAVVVEKPKRVRLERKFLLYVEGQGLIRIDNEGGAMPNFTTGHIITYTSRSATRHVGMFDGTVLEIEGDEPPFLDVVYKHWEEAMMHLTLNGEVQNEAQQSQDDLRERRTSQVHENPSWNQDALKSPMANHFIYRLYHRIHKHF